MSKDFKISQGMFKSELIDECSRSYCSVEFETGCENAIVFKVFYKGNTKRNHHLHVTLTPETTVPSIVLVDNSPERQIVTPEDIEHFADELRLFERIANWLNRYNPVYEIEWSK